MSSLMERPISRRSTGYSPSTQVPGLYDPFDEIRSTRTTTLARPADARHRISQKTCKPSLVYESSSTMRQALKSSFTTYREGPNRESEEEVLGSEDAQVIRLPPKRRVPLTVQVVTRVKGRIINYDLTEIDL